MRSILALSVFAVAGLARADDLPAWKPSEMKNLDADGWAAPSEIDGHAVRAAKAGRSAVLTVPVWWGQTFRPPEPAVYIAKVTYQDTATQPVVFSSHAGVGGYWGLSEVHRFGGLGDKQWKTADVPISWDLICRKNVPGNVTELAVSANADLPIESIRLVPADNGAPERYFQETRDWVARVQAQKRQSAGRGDKQAASLPAALKDQPLVAYPCSWMFPLPPDAVCPPDKAGAPVNLRLAQNEYEPAAFAVYANGGALSRVNYNVGPLTNKTGQLKCELDLRTAEYSAVQETVDYGATADSGKYKLVPQRLWPAYPVDIPPGQSHLFWITLRTLGAQSKPGKYTGAITVTGKAGGGRNVQAALPIKVDVVGVTLPTVHEAGLSLGNCTAGLPTLQEVKTLAEHNHTRLDIWFGGTQPQMKVEGGKLALDWTYLDDWMAGAAKAGLTEIMWFFGGDPFGFPDTLNLERDLYRAGVGDRRDFIKKTNAAPEKVIGELRGLYVEFIRQTAAHAKDKNWPKLIVQPFDEPAKHASTKAWDNPFEKVVGAGPWIQGHFRDSCDLIRQGDPNLPIALEAHVVEPCLVFLKDVNIFCTNRAYTYPNLADKLKAAGVTFWQYANCDDQSPAHRQRYSFGFYFGAFNSRGALVWAYNFMKRFDTSGIGNWGSAWYTPFGTVMTPALVGLREGLDDRRWMEAYKAQVGRAGLPASSVGRANLPASSVGRANSPASAATVPAPADALLEEIAKEALAERAKTRYDSYNEAAHPEKMDQWRELLIDIVGKQK